MSGIKDLLILYHWMGNDKAFATKQPLYDRHKHIPRDRQLIINELEKEGKLSALQTTMNKWK